MGIPAPAVELLLDLHRRRPLCGPALTLGALDIDFVPTLRDRSLAATPRGFVRPEAFFAALGLLELDALDVSPDEGATIVHDLARPLPDALVGRFGLIVDGGTLERFADIYAGLENVMRLLAPGGRVVHVAPVSGWENHGFYCPQPKLFFRAYAANGFGDLEGWLLHSSRSGDGPAVALPIGEDVERFETDSLRARTLLFFTATKGRAPDALVAPVDTRARGAHASRFLELPQELRPSPQPSVVGRLVSGAERVVSEARALRDRARERARPALPPTRAPIDDALYWNEDAEFNRVFATGTGVFGNGPRDRYYSLKELLLSLGRIDADTAEVGVFEGFGSYVIRSYLPQIATPGVRHHLFDSFEGLSDPSETDRPVRDDVRTWRRGDMQVGLERVRQNLRMFDDLEFHRGWIPRCFDDCEGLRFAFVHLDVDLYEPTRGAFEFFYPRLVPGGLFVFDDHGFLTCPGARRAIDEQAAMAGVPIVRLTTGQAFLRKP